MSADNSYPILGIDGGGTSCRIGLSIAGQVTQVHAGPANITTNFDAAIATISRGITEVAQRAGVARAALTDAHAYLGLAGVMAPQMGRQVADALALNRAQVGDDRLTMLTGALGGAHGAVAGVGTGSFLARQSHDGTQLMGGYGFSLGDDASGAWLGHTLLRHCLRVLDGMAPPSPLTRQILEQFSNLPKALIDFAQDADPADFGTFAPQIMEAARAGDATGITLAQTGANYITDALAALGWSPKEPLCLTGGLGPHYAPFLPKVVGAALIAPRGSGLDGALLLAQLAARNTEIGTP